MVNILRGACRIAVLAIFAGQYSCIDKQYDLSDLDTDDITIGNDLTLPLGTGVISAGDIINVGDNDEITIDDAGNYVARYSGGIDVDMPGGVGFGDSEFPESRLDIPLVPGKHPHDYPEDAEIELGESAVELNLTTDDIARLDSVLFDNRNGASRLGLELSVDNLRLDGGDAEMVFRASFPEGYRLAAETGQDGSFTGSEYTCTIPMRELAGSQKTVRLLLQKAVVGADDRIAYNASLRIKKGSSLSVSGSPGLRISGGISSPDFRVIYGLIDDNFTAGQVDIATEGLDDLFDGDDNVLSFADPRIRLTAQSNIGIPLRASFAMTSVNDRSGATESVTVDRITMNAPGAYGQTAVSNIWLGASDRDVPAEYTFTACPVNDLIRISPDDIAIRTEVRTDTDLTDSRACFYPKDAFARIAYTAEIPLAPAADFRGQTDQTVDEVFDADLIDYLFSGGSAEIYGRVTNSLPPNFDMNLIVTDAADVPVGIDFEPQKVKGGGLGTDGEVSDVSFVITEADMPKMKNARNLRIRLEAYCDDALAGRHLRPDQQAKLTLKLRKSGGINITTNE